MSNSKGSLNKCPCGKVFKGKNLWISCSSCGQWWHCKCVCLTKEVTEIFRKKDLTYECPICLVDKFNLSNSNFDAKDGSDSVKEVRSKVKGKENDEQIDQQVANLKGKEIPDEILGQDKLSKESSEVVIIDGLSSPCKFSDSRIIKKEIYKHKENIKIKFAYPLSRGGIAVHVEKEEEKDILKECWPKEAFKGCGENLDVHSIEPKPRCVFKNLSVSLDESVIAEEVKRQVGINVSVRRLRYRDTNKLMPIAVISCKTFEDLSEICRSSISIANRKVKKEAYRSKRNIPTRCYNCQGFGHIAKACTKEKKCEKCSESHEGSCSGVNRCANCGLCHKASYKKCPVYVSLLERLTARK